MADDTRQTRNDDMARDTGTVRDTDAPRDSNPDPITGAPGAHPVGTGVGAAAAGAAGAAIGSVIPGVGTVVGGAVGAVVGAVAGGLAGKGVAEAINPTAEDEYWRGEYRNRPYYTPGADYDRDYAPAYRAGYTAAGSQQYRNRDWNQVERDLGTNWESARGQSNLTWDKARDASRDAWERASSSRSGSGSDINFASNPSMSGAGDLGTTGSSSGTTAAGARDSMSGAGRMSGAGSSAGGGGFNDPDVDTFARTCETRYAGRRFDEVETDLRRDWDTDKNHGNRTWESVKDGVRRAWHKVERAMPGDADRDGR